MKTKSTQLSILVLVLFALGVQGDGMSMRPAGELIFCPDYMMDLIKCKAEYQGPDKIVTDTQDFCKKWAKENATHNSNLCVNLCTWKELGYFTEMGSGPKKMNETAIENISKALYKNQDSVNEKTKDFTNCFSSSRPQYDFEYHGKCEDVAPFYNCYVTQMSMECENFKRKTKGSY